MKKKIIYILILALVFNTGCYSLSPIKYSSSDLIDPNESIRITMKDSTMYSLNGGEYKIANDTIWYMEKFDLSSKIISVTKVPADSVAYFHKEAYDEGGTVFLIVFGTLAAVAAIILLGHPSFSFNL